MKKSILLALGLGTLCVLALTGCKDTPIRTTPLPGAGTPGNGSISEHVTPELRTTPINGLKDGEGIVKTSGTGESPLPDDIGLNDREQDRATFSAQTVYFEYDHSNVRANEGLKIDQVVTAFRSKGRGYDLLVEGHCDEAGTEEYNRSLGERRALAVRELLIKSGVDGAHIFTRTFGKDRPASPGHDEASRSKNRRGEFVLVLPKKITTTQNQQ